MIELHITNIFFIIIGIFCIIPTYALYIYYKQTRILEFFILGTAFLVTILQSIVLILLDTSWTNLNLQRLDDVIYATYVMLFLVHGMRFRWHKSPRVLKMFFIIWYLFLILSPLFYKMVELPENGMVLFFELRNVSPRDEGAMLIVANRYIIGVGFELLSHLFRLITLGLLVITYLNSKQISKEMDAEAARMIFILSIFFAMLFPMFMILDMFSLVNTTAAIIDLHIFDVLALIGITYIGIRKPDTLLISQVQVLRLRIQHGLNLFTGEEKNVKVPNIQNYIKIVKSMFPELLAKDKV